MTGRVDCEAQIEAALHYADQLLMAFSGLKQAFLRSLLQHSWPLPVLSAISRNLFFFFFFIFCCYSCFCRIFSFSIRPIRSIHYRFDWPFAFSSKRRRSLCSTISLPLSCCFVFSFSLSHQLKVFVYFSAHFNVH